MMRLRRTGDALELRLGAAETRVLHTLATELAEVLGGDDAARSADPALARLLPDAYRDDSEAAAEFARWTRGDLATAKVGVAREIAAAASGQGRPRAATVRLDHDAAERWTRGLTDLRLVLAERLGIRRDDDAPPLSRDGAVYWWLGGLQESLVGALDRWDEEDADGPRPR